MAANDPAEKALIRLEMRRFTGRCQNNEALIQRADSLREIARLAAMSLPYKIAGEFEAREAQRRLLLLAEDRAKEVIQDQIATIFKVDASHRLSVQNKVNEDWANLSGPLGHLRNWAKLKLTAAAQIQS